MYVCLNLYIYVHQRGINETTFRFFFNLIGIKMWFVSMRFRKVKTKSKHANNIANETEYILSLQR